MEDNRDLTLDKVNKKLDINLKLLNNNAVCNIINVNQSEYIKGRSDFKGAFRKVVACFIGEPSSVELYFSGAKKSLMIKKRMDESNRYSKNISKIAKEIYIKRSDILKAKSYDDISSIIGSDSKVLSGLNDLQLQETGERFNVDLNVLDRSTVSKIVNVDQTEYVDNKKDFKEALNKVLTNFFSNSSSIVVYLSNSKKSIMLRKSGKKTKKGSIDITNIAEEVYKNRNSILKAKSCDEIASIMDSDLSVLVKAASKSENLSKSVDEIKNIDEESAKSCAVNYIMRIFEKEIKPLLYSIDRLDAWRELIKARLNQNEGIEVEDGVKIKALYEIKEAFPRYTFNYQDIHKFIIKKKKPQDCLSFALVVGDHKLYDVNLAYDDGEIRVIGANSQIKKYLDRVDNMKLLYKTAINILEIVIRFKSKFKKMILEHIGSHSDDFINTYMSFVSKKSPNLIGFDINKIAKLKIDDLKIDLITFNYKLDVFDSGKYDYTSDLEEELNRMHDYLYNVVHEYDVEQVKNDMAFLIKVIYKRMEKFLVSSMNVFNNLNKKDILWVSKNFRYKNLSNAVERYLNWLEVISFDIEDGIMSRSDLEGYLEGLYSRLNDSLYKENNLYYKCSDEEMQATMYKMALDGFIVSDESGKVNTNHAFVNELFEYLGMENEPIKNIDIESIDENILLGVLNGDLSVVNSVNINPYDISYELLNRTSFSDRLTILLINLIEKVDGILLYVPEYRNLFKHMDEKFIRLLELKNKQYKSDELKIFLNETLYIGLGKEQFKNDDNMEYLSYFDKTHEAQLHEYHSRILALHLN